ncbi:MAG: histidinol-phosphate transaminase [Parasporobacterium sp.]|nr:histidinol-phosphate transaminase [Parasporobacterium sp.]
MSRFFSNKYDALTPYTPGEQPRDNQYIKLNTNESPYMTSELAVKYASEEAKRMRLYSDPECTDLVKKAADYFGIETDEIVFTNGSDEALNFAVMAFCDEKTGAVFPDITYGFYPVICSLNNIDYTEIPLNDDLTLNTEDYYRTGKTVFLANPNAPTGVALPLEEVERIVKENPDTVVVVDEAYVDFGTESAVGLIHEYDNLLVVQTMSKSRSLAGGRLGYAIGNRELIRDLNTLKYSTNPYNVNRMTMAAGIGAFEDDQYMKDNCRKIIETREKTKERLKALGFILTDSKANFLFAKHPMISGGDLYQKLKERNVLVRYFAKPRLMEYTRITIGTEEQMDIYIRETEDILNGVKE